ncbi:MAG: hypothetical protein ACREN2_08215 [Candidatus Dormibacteria bacterium]
MDQQANGFSDQAVWLANYNGGINASQSLEVGMYSGAGYNITWTTHILPYSTYSSGSGENDVNQPLTGGQGIWMAVNICAGCGGSIMQVGSYVGAIDGGAYPMDEPRTNFTAGEVGGKIPNEYGDNNPTSWMCGGYDVQAMEWADAAGWYHWGGNMTTVADYPYQAQTDGGYYFACQGYGMR